MSAPNSNALPGKEGRASENDSTPESYPRPTATQALPAERDGASPALEASTPAVGTLEPASPATAEGKAFLEALGTEEEAHS